MPEKHLFEYAVLRAVPRVEREEFINIGVILYCRSLQFLDMRMHLEVSKLLCIDPGCCVEDFEPVIRGILHVCSGDPEAGPIALLPAPERFRWLTAKRSTIVQTSAVHVGLTHNATETLHRIYEQVVL